MTTHHGDRFNGLARLEDQEDGCTARLLRRLTYVTHDGWVLEVPAGFVTDFASIPRALWTIIPPRGRYNRPAIIHDFLYRFAPTDPQTGVACTQQRADAVLREACENCDDRFTQRWAIYLGLRAGGWLTWRRYRKAAAALKTKLARSA